MTVSAYHLNKDGILHMLGLFAQKEGNLRLFRTGGNFLSAFFFLTCGGWSAAGCRGLRGARGVWGRGAGRGGGGKVGLEAQVFTYKWTSKQYAGGSNIPH